MILPTTRIRRNSFALVFIFVFIPAASADSRQAMDSANRWVAAKFLGEADHTPQPSHLLPHFPSESLGRNRVKGRALQIANQKFKGGLFFPSDGKVHVVLNGPAKSFEAVVGIDSNDVGYYSNVGRGAAVASRAYCNFPLRGETADRARRFLLLARDG